MTDRELMQQALDALDSDNPDIQLRSATALRARLAQPEQEIESDQDHVEDDGCPTEKAVLQRFWREHQMQEPVATLFGSLPVYDVPPAKPVAWVENLENARPHCVTDLKYCSVAQHERGEHLKYIPLYTTPPQREWQGLTEYEVGFLTVFDGLHDVEVPLLADFIRHIEAKLKEKNA